MKVAAAIANVLVQIAAALFVGFMLLIGLNGYSEQQATPGLLLYIILALASALGVGAASFWTIARLAEKTSLGNFGAAAIAFVIYIIVGVTVLIVTAFAAVILIEALRK